MSTIEFSEIIETSTDHITVPHCHHGLTTGSVAWI